MALDIFTIIRIAVVSIALLFCCIGTGVEQFKSAGGSTKLYLVGAKTDGGSLVRYGDIFCKAYSERFDAALAFAIISCILIGFLLIAIVLKLFMTNLARVLGIASVGLSVAAVFTTLLAWSITISIFHGKWCGNATSLYENDYKIVGTALLIVTWLLMIVDAVLAVFGLTRPAHAETNK